MDARHLIAIALVLLAGCQSGGNTELMERELRLQEDRIYYLEDELARCCEAMQCRQAELAARGDQPAAAKSAPPRRSTPAPPPGVPADEIPKVELTIPDDPAPLNGLPSLFDPASPASEKEGTAMRIVRPTNQVAAANDEPQPSSEKPADSPRMRFASALAEPASAGSSRVVMQWSAAPGDRESAVAEPRTAVAPANPRRPQWSPYR